MEGTDAPPAAPSLTGRLAAAIALTVGFYLLAVTIAGALLAAAILPWILADHGNPWISITGLALGGSILYAIVPRRVRFEPPGVLITVEDQPALLALIDEEARAHDIGPPDEVYADFSPNAGVREARRKRIMVIGLPLVRLLSERGLRGIVAHELGHYAGGDTRLGPWIHRTREAIARTLDRLTPDDVETLTQRAVRAPFEWYARAFLWITAAISQREELAADRFAARRAGRDVHLASLRRVHAFAPAFDAYWAEEIVPALELSRRPPVAAGFASFVATERIERIAGESLERELREAKTGRYDSHPSLADRIRALEQLEAGAQDDSPPAWELVAGASELEARVCAWLLGPETAAALRPIAWAEVPEEVILARARLGVELFSYVPGGETVGGLGGLLGRSTQLAGEIHRREPARSLEEAAAIVRPILGDALLTTLADAGWAVAAEVGEPIACRREGCELYPGVVVRLLAGGELDAGAWAAQARELGIAGLPLAPHERVRAPA